MDSQRLLARLDGFRNTLAQLVLSVHPDDARWKPTDADWSILEIVRHLADEEVEDFRTRVRMTLEQPTAAWPPIDPVAAAIERKYNDGRLQNAVAQFCIEREKSLLWLRPNLERITRQADQVHQHPQLGDLRLGDLFASWVAHDQLHLRQIARRLHQLTERDAAPFTTGYAGDW